MNTLRRVLPVMMILSLVTVSSVWAATLLYDNVGRLVSVDYGDGNTIAYTYDSAGNRLTLNATGTGVDGPRLSASVGTTNLPYTQSTPAVQVSNTGQGTLIWTAVVTEGAEWLSISSGASGSGDGAVVLLALANPGASRQGTVRIEAIGAADPVQLIAFTQAADPSVSDVTPEAQVDRYVLLPNRPNPFNPTTQIKFGVPEKARISLTIFDVRGRIVRTLLDGVTLERGWHVETWDGTDDRGGQVASGVYLYRLDAGKFCETRRALLMK